MYDPTLLPSPAGGTRSLVDAMAIEDKHQAAAIGRAAANLAKTTSKPLPKTGFRGWVQRNVPFTGGKGVRATVADIGHQAKVLEGAGRQAKVKVGKGYVWMPAPSEVKPGDLTTRTAVSDALKARMPRDFAKAHPKMTGAARLGGALGLTYAVDPLVMSVIGAPHTRSGWDPNKPPPEYGKYSVGGVQGRNE